MTVIDNTPRDQYTASSGQTVFPYTFEISASGDIVVLQNGAILNEGTGAGQYGISGVGSDSGGNITLVTGATTGDVITLYRDMALDRLTSYTNGGDFLAADVNNDFDRLWLALQQNTGTSNRALVAPNTDPLDINMTIPDKDARRSKFLKFNSVTGNPEASNFPPGDFAASGMNVYDFTGDGATVNYTLGMEPGGDNNTQIYIDGVYQQKINYSVFGAIVTFSTAPPNLSSIEVMVIEALPVGSASAPQVTFTQAGSTYGSNVQRKLEETVSVKDFGAVGDGVTDDTAAIQAAIAASESIYFPPGNYVITNTIYTRGEFDGIWWRGKRLFGAGPESTTITAAVGFTDSVMIHIGNKDYLTDSKYCIKNELSGMTINNYNMLNTTSDVGVLTFGTYDNRLSDLAIVSLAYPFTRWDLAIDKGTYTTIVDNVHCQNLQVASATVGDVTTISFYGCSATFVNVVNGVAINFDHLTVQGNYSGVYQQNRIQISNSVNVAFLNGDIEGDGVAFNIAGSVGVEITGNNVAMPGSYTTLGGVTENSKWIVLDGCSQVRSQGNIFLNWVKGPSAPAPGTYLVETGTNSKLDLIDFNGDTFTGASYARADAQVLTDAANVIINYDSPIYDSGTYYLVSYAPSVFTGTNLVTTGAAWKFTCPISGVYAVSASAVIAAFAQATDYAFITINVNGVEKFRMWNGSPVFSGILSLAIQGSVYCDIDDYIDIRITCDGAAERSLSAAATGNRVNIDYIGTF